MKFHRFCRLVVIGVIGYGWAAAPQRRERDWAAPPRCFVGVCALRLPQDDHPPGAALPHAANQFLPSGGGTARWMSWSLPYLFILRAVLEECDILFAKTDNNLGNALRRGLRGFRKLMRALQLSGSIPWLGMTRAGDAGHDSVGSIAGMGEVGSQRDGLSAFAQRMSLHHKTTDRNSGSNGGE